MTGANEGFVARRREGGEGHEARRVCVHHVLQVRSVRSRWHKLPAARRPFASFALRYLRPLRVFALRLGDADFFEVTYGLPV